MSQVFHRPRTERVRKLRDSETVYPGCTRRGDRHYHPRRQARLRDLRRPGRIRTRAHLRAHYRRAGVRPRPRPQRRTPLQDDPSQATPRHRLHGQARHQRRRALRRARDQPSNPLPTRLPVRRAATRRTQASRRQPPQDAVRTTREAPPFAGCSSGRASRHRTCCRSKHKLRGARQSLPLHAAPCLLTCGIASAGALATRADPANRGTAATLGFAHRGVSDRTRFWRGAGNAGALGRVSELL
jgi:hypothetical protein